MRARAMCALAIDSKLRECDVLHARRATPLCRCSHPYAAALRIPLPDGAAQPPPPPPSSNTRSFLSVVGTPFFLAFKIPVCILTAVAAALIAGLSEFSPNGTEVREPAGYTVDSICGPPYVVSP
jgi:hypothetical protein